MVKPVYIQAQDLSTPHEQTWISQIDSEPCDTPARVGLPRKVTPTPPGFPDPGRFDSTPTFLTSDATCKHIEVENWLSGHYTSCVPSTNASMAYGDIDRCPDSGKSPGITIVNGMTLKQLHHQWAHQVLFGGDGKCAATTEPRKRNVRKEGKRGRGELCAVYMIHL